MTVVGLGVAWEATSISVTPVSTMVVLRVTFCNVLVRIAKNCAPSQEATNESQAFGLIL